MPTMVAVKIMTAVLMLAAGVPAAGPATPVPECPPALACDFVPAAYASNDAADANAYGNYDPADRPSAELPIRYIVIHDTEGSFDGTVEWFQNPAAYTSSHYVIRSSDGHVTQMVRNSDIAWHAGNSLINARSIGIEHEGYGADGTGFTDEMYESSATLVRYLAAKYHIPLDRQHILGHDDIANQKRFADSHWDPGPHWDWARYMRLLRAPQPLPGHALVTVDTDVALLRTGPSDDAPLIVDPVIGGGTEAVDDWSDKAQSGRQYAVAERRGAWTAIWFGGQRAWLRSELLAPAAGAVIRPRAGVPVPVFPANLPEPGEWPAGTPAGNPVTPPAPTPLYTISGDQRYQLADRDRAQVYYARFDGNDVPLNHTVIRGAETYLRISFHHRYMYVRARDVELSR